MNRLDSVTSPTWASFFSFNKIYMENFIWRTLHLFITKQSWPITVYVFSILVELFLFVLGGEEFYCGELSESFPNYSECPGDSPDRPVCIPPAPPGPPAPPCLPADSGRRSPPCCPTPRTPRRTPASRRPPGTAGPSSPWSWEEPEGRKWKNRMEIFSTLIGRAQTRLDSHWSRGL